jgi:Met-zincin
MQRTFALLVWCGFAMLQAAGCHDEPVDETLLAGDPVVAIARTVDAAAQQERSAVLRRYRLGRRDRSDLGEEDRQDFYLAVRRSMLKEPWFLSYYLKELSPFGPNPSTLGTRVVRFREQNGKLYVFDADRRRATSDVFRPELIVDAFPIVQSNRIHSLPGSGDYVVIDPAAGLNRFGAIADAFASSFAAVKLQTELSFVQRFRRYDDGATFEQIITTYADFPVGDPGGVDPNAYRLAATLGVSLRRYRESPRYVRVPEPPASHYFLGAPYNLTNLGGVAHDAIHWALAPGMTPIPWLISPKLAELAANPDFGGADLVAAAKRGVESWNEVLGFRAFTAELDTGDHSFAEDRVNYIIIDPDPSYGFAYADWRTNPNTAEILGASIYIGGAFFFPFPDDPPAAGSLPLAKPAVTRLTWQDQRTAPLCVLWGPRYGEFEPSGNPGLTGRQKQEAYFQEVIVHEIGHTLGLRHNFKGSLTPPTSSVMEYNVREVRIAHPEPGAYDRDAIKFLYGQADELPAQPFCTDEDTAFDPNCVPGDEPSPTPLRDFQIPRYRGLVDQMITGQLPPGFAASVVRGVGRELFAYVRTGTSEEAGAAWSAALDRLRAPLSADELAANPALGRTADAMSGAVFQSIYQLFRAAPTDPAVIEAIAHDGEAVLVNGDHVRSFATRRAVVDALKLAQNTPAFLALTRARAAIAASLGGLSPTDLALTQDLLARIDSALAPYFER